MSSMGIIIRKYRIARALTQEDIAIRMNISLRSYRNIEKGFIKLDVERLLEIAGILDIEMRDLIEAIIWGDVREMTPNFQSYPNNPAEEIPETERRVFERLLKDKDEEIAYLREMLKLKVQ